MTTSSYVWLKEDAPAWDTQKDHLFGAAEIAAVGIDRPQPDESIADEWWRVVDASAAVVAYGWLDSEWGDARISFVVAAGHRGQGIGEFVIDHLEDEAFARGLNYIYNVIPASHPNPSWIRHWLIVRGFSVDPEGNLRRRSRTAASAT